jgi:hypothetical protein
LLYGLKTLCGINSMNALPELLFSDEALMPVVGCNAQQVRQGVCRRGATKRQDVRPPGPICPDTLAKNMVKVNVRDLEALFNGVIRTLAKAGGFGKRVTGIVDGTDLETTERDAGCGQAPRKRRLEDTWGRVYEIEVTVYGWKVLLLIDAVTKISLAVKVVKMHEHEALWTRALGTQARVNLAGAARLHTVVFDKAFLAGTDLWWLDQRGILCVVPAKDTLAGTADARALATAGEGVTVGRRATRSATGRARRRGPNGWKPRWGDHKADDVGAAWDRGTRASPPPPRFRAQPDPCRRGAPVEGEGLWAGGQNRVPDQGRGGAAVAAL